ncbi:MAG: D-2-hydroxyacid dehydrogenase [Chloroflexota bacterium]|nr:MAG: D-2-hydroxyacid dehydrogenase [Chloroflexota bacterium]
MPFKMLFLPPLDDHARATARAVADAIPGARVVLAETDADAVREIVDADAAHGHLPAPLLTRATRLRWLSAPAIAPPAGYYYPALASHPVVVTNPRGIFNDRIPAHILAFVLAFARGLHVYMRQQLRAEWSRIGTEATGVVHLPESTALIVGVGEIGAETARLCAAFGMRVLGIDARRTDVPEGVAALHRPDELDRLLPEADFVILTIPHTPETEGLFDAGRFARMKRGAYFINIGRGMTTRLADLDRALRDGTIAGAGLDVFEVEPLPPEHPLWTAPNTLLTPHVAGHGPHLDERRVAVVVENARRFAVGQPLRNVVDKARWF